MVTLRKLFVVIASVITCLALAVPAHAINAPDSIDILAKYVFRNLLETGDRLFVFHYELAYAVYPTDYAVDDAFIFSLKDGTDLLGTVLAYPYWNEAPGDAQGYGEGVVGFYFEDSDAIDWDEPYTVNIAGNPLVFPSPPSQDFNLSVNDYTALTAQADNKLSLANTIRDIADDLEITWTAVLLDTQDAGIVLSSEGEEYFVNAIPGLRAMAPALFYVQQVALDTTRRVWTTDYADTLGSGTVAEGGMGGSIIDTGLTGGGSLFGVDKKVFGSFVVVGMITACLAFAQMKLGNIWIGWAASSLVLAGGVRLSLVHMAVIAIFGLFSIIMFFWQIFGSKSG